MQDVVHCPVSGGFKRVLTGTTHGSQIDLGEALVRETELETGFHMAGNEFRVVALCMSTADYSPLIAAVARVPEERLKLCETEIQKPIGLKSHGFHKDAETQRLLYSVDSKAFVPQHVPRDWWEGNHLIKIRLNASLLATDPIECSKAWKTLRVLWEDNQRAGKVKMDFPAASIIATITQVFK